MEHGIADAGTTVGHALYFYEVCHIGAIGDLHSGAGAELTAVHGYLYKMPPFLAGIIAYVKIYIR